jgi:hypothetical protein
VSRATKRRCEMLSRAMVSSKALTAPAGLADGFHRVTSASSALTIDGLRSSKPSLSQRFSLETKTETLRLD